MRIEKVVVGYLRENCYILSIDNFCLVIDPGDEYDRIKDVIGDKSILGILITHHHFDHVGALSYFDNIPIYDFNTTKEDSYKVGPFDFKVIRLPGHKDDLVGFYFYKENVLFAGDFIFYESIGRYDLEGSSYDDMVKSINKIKNYPMDMKIYPGHGRDTSLGHELKYNDFIRSVL